MLGVTLLLFVSSLWAFQAVIERQKFKIWKGYKLSNGTEIKEIRLTNMSLVRCASFCTEVCESATFSRALNLCVTFKESVYGSSIKRISDPQWYILYKNKPVTVGNWTLVFKAQRDINQSLYDLWTSTGTSDDNPLSVNFPVECLQLTYSNTCTRHFRSYILDQWVNIDKVRFALYTNGLEVSNIVFDGRNTTWTSWFTKSKIINSTWDFMKYDPLIKDFSIYGFEDGSSKRRFSIFGSTNGCHLDTAYFLAIDTFTDVCTPYWNMAIRSFPRFIYSPMNSMVFLISDPLGRVLYNLADVMTIFVSFTSP